MGQYDFKFFPGSLEQAGGKLPDINGCGAIAVAWQKKQGQYHFTVTVEKPITVHFADRSTPLEIEREGSFVFGAAQLKREEVAG